MALERLTQITNSGITSGITITGVNLTGIVTATSANIGSGITLSGTQINVGSATTIHSSGFQIGSSNLHSTGISLNNINASGIVTATTFNGNLTGNVTGNATGLSGTPSITVATINASNATFSGNVSIAGTLTYEDVTNIDSVGIITARSGIRVNSGGLVVTSGVSTFTNSPILIGSGTSTGTTSQPLQVTGGAYVSGNLGVGATNPSSKLEVNGTSQFVATSSSSATVDAGIYVNTPLQTISAFFGSNAITNALTGNQYSTAIRFNGSNVAWGDISYYPNQSGQGHFRFSTAGSSVNTTPNATIGVGALYCVGNIGVGTANPRTSLHVNGNIIGYVASGSGILYTTYGALSNSQVANYNNNLLGYNLRGYVSSVDGGASNDNFYAMYTAPYGFSGIEQAYGGAINFYTCNSAYQSTTANTTVTPRLAAVINPGGTVTVGDVLVGTNHIDIMKMWRTADIQGYKNDYSDGGSISYTWDNGTVRIDTSIGSHNWDIGKVRLPVGIYQLYLQYRPSPTQHGWNVYGTNSNAHIVRLISDAGYGSFSTFLTVSGQLNKDVGYSYLFKSGTYEVSSETTYRINMGTDPYTTGGYKCFVEASYLIKIR